MKKMQKMPDLHMLLKKGKTKLGNKTRYAQNRTTTRHSLAADPSEILIAYFRAKMRMVGMCRPSPAGFWILFRALGSGGYALRASLCPTPCLLCPAALN